ncbi:MAG: DUF177 domain-containing protein [Thermoanaerobaculia bacterium]
MKEILDLEKVASQSPQAFDLSLRIPADELDRDEVASMSEVRAWGEIGVGDRPREFVLSGAVEYTADLLCSRCLDPFPFAIRSDFHLTYLPRPAAESAESLEEVEVAGEQLDEEYYEEPHIDLQPVILEQVQLSLPMKALCDEGCKGLCVVCKGNRNRSACECAVEESDSRWDALRGIREQLAKKKEN